MADPRTIDNYLRSKGSPLAGYGRTFVEAGRRHGVDPLLLVAISGAESEFGKRIKPGTNNPFGWGPHIPFPSFEAAIETVARGLRRGYLDEGRTTVQQIGSKWAPLGANNDPTNLNSNWTRNVSQLLGELGGGVPSSAPSPLPPSAAGADATAPPESPSSGGASSLLRSLYAANNALLGVPTPGAFLAKLQDPVAPTFSPPDTPSPAWRPASSPAYRKPPRGTAVQNVGRFLELFAAPFGVTVTSSTGGRHTLGSYHYRDADKGGRARDFGGSPAQLAALARAALKRPQDFREMFYTGPGSPGFFIKNGRVYPISQLDRKVVDGHRGHLHLAR